VDRELVIAGMYVSILPVLQSCSAAYDFLFHLINLPASSRSSHALHSVLPCRAIYDSKKSLKSGLLSTEQLHAEQGEYEDEEKEQKQK